MTDNRGALPISINGLRYQVNLDHYRRQTISPTRQLYDTGGESSETTLSNEHLWKRIQEDWTHGAGQLYFDDTAETDRKRFYSSDGVDVWTKRQLRLLNDTDQVGDFHSLAVPYVQTRNWLMTIGNNLYRLEEIHFPGTIEVPVESWSWELWRVDNPDSTWDETSVEGNTGVLYDFAHDGQRLFVSTNFGVHVYDTIADSSADYHGDDPGELVDWHFVTFAGNRCIVARNATAPGAGSLLDEMAADGTFTTIWDQANDFSWTDGTSAPNGIYLSGYTGVMHDPGIDFKSRGIIYYVGINDATGALENPVPACELPVGEVPLGIFYYGGFVIIGTDLGIRVASIESSRNGLTYGPLLPLGQVSLFEGEGEFVWFDWGGKLGRLDMSRFVGELQPAYASDLVPNTSSGHGGAFLGGDITSITRLGGFTYFGSVKYLYRELDQCVASGEIVFSRYNFGTSEQKRFTEVAFAIDHFGVQQYLDVDVTANSGVVESDQLAGTSPTHSFDSTLLTETTGEWAQISLTLTATLDYFDPIINRVTLKALPIPTQLEEIYLPIILKDEVADGDTPIGMDPFDEMSALQALRAARAVVPLVMGAETLSVFIHSILTGMDTDAALDGHFNSDGSWPEGVWLLHCISVPAGNVDPTTITVHPRTIDAVDVRFAPYGTIAATNVQTAIQELLDEAGAGGLGEVIDDETPTLGGDLDTDGHRIVGGVRTNNFVMDDPANPGYGSIVGGPTFVGPLLAIYGNRTDVNARAVYSLLGFQHGPGGGTALDVSFNRSAVGQYTLTGKLIVTGITTLAAGSTVAGTPSTSTMIVNKGYLDSVIGSGEATSSAAGTPRDLALNEKLMKLANIVPFPPGANAVSTDPWPFSGYTNFTSGNIYLMSDCSFKTIGPTTIGGAFRRTLKLEATVSFAKSGLTFIGGTHFADPDVAAQDELTMTRDNWHDCAGLEIDVPDTTLIGLQIYNVGDGITAGVSDGGERASNLKVIGCAFDAPPNFQTVSGAPSTTGDRFAWIHDDAIELDTYETTLVDDCLFNGVYDGISFLNPGAGATFDKRANTITIRNCLFRVGPIYAPFGATHWKHGPWFKFHNTASYAGYRPNLIIEDCVFYSPGDDAVNLGDWINPFDLPTNQGGSQVVSAERCKIIWPGETFPYKTHWDLYGTDIEYFDNVSDAAALAEWNRLADIWRKTHVPLEVGRVAASAGGTVDGEFNNLQVNGILHADIEAVFADGIALGNGKDIRFGTTVGGYIGGHTNEKFCFWDGNEDGPVVAPTGWAKATGTELRTTFNADTATLDDLAPRLAAVINTLWKVGLFHA